MFWSSVKAEMESEARREQLLREAEAYRRAKRLANGSGMRTRIILGVADWFIGLGFRLKARYSPDGIVDYAAVHNWREANGKA